MLETLVDRASGDVLPLGAALETRYGGPLRLAPRAVFANFVSTIDGVVSYGVPGIAAARYVSEGHPADRFMLALLRAVADAVIVGAGTLRNEPKAVWTPEQAFPGEAAAFAELRESLGRPPQPHTIIASMRGDVDLSLPAFHAPAPVVIATTRAGAERIGRAPAGVSIETLDEPIAMRALVDLAARVSGGTRILTEGGPTILGRFVEEGAVDELFLTVAPRLAGRSEELRRLALVEGTAFTPKTAPRARLVSLKIGDDYLFTRYALGSP